jgi:Ni,Fe-hydrogenase I small subunit
MAITRRQFVTRLGALAAAAGFSQVEASKIMDAVAYDPSSAPGNVYQGNFGKPRVVWLHGAECTGCSTSLLGIFENVGGTAVYGATAAGNISTATAAVDAGILPINIPGLNPGTTDFTLTHNGLSPDPAGSMNIADVVIDVIDLLYHETVMGMGGDLAFQWLMDFTTTNNKPFVLVVEGAMQDSTKTGAWNDASTVVPWCSIGHSNAWVDGKAVYDVNGVWQSGYEIDTPDLVAALAIKPECVAIVAIGQCATFGGYPGCKPPISAATAGFDPTQSQTGAKGVFEYLSTYVSTGHGSAMTTVAVNAAANKVVNSPGCPTNPWWFVLTVVAWMVDANAVLAGSPVGPLGILGTGLAIVGGVDNDRRLLAVYGTPVHGPKCPRYKDFVAGKFAAKPGDPGCLQKIGCKGPATNSLCGLHGWNGQQPENPASWDNGVSHANKTSLASVFNGGHCPRAGHPCMACTEKGYPDNFVPFVVRS